MATCPLWFSILYSVTLIHFSLQFRWFDKSVSLLMTSKGDAAVNFEHSWGDGVAVMSLFNAMFSDSNTNPAASSRDIATSEPQVTKLGEYVVTPQVLGNQSSNAFVLMLGEIAVI